jgi:predicted choloylglycine hydrolase
MDAAELTFTAVAEATPGAGFAARFGALWPALREWFLRDGDAARPRYAVAQARLEAHMPELVPTWRAMVELAGGGDLAARMLALYDPPPLMAGCSQAVVDGALVRNYDYHPAKLEGTVLRSELTGRAVLGTSDCLWGLLDGINADGLAVALAFGGRRVLGDGFGITIVVRYVLETCATVEESVDVLARLPIHAPYNLTLADAAGDAATVFVGPDRAARATQPPVATNHQEAVEWEDYGRATRTVERHAALCSLLPLDPERAADALLAPPLYATDFWRGFGTLYTAVYRPAARTLEYRWPGERWTLALDAFTEGTRAVTLPNGADGRLGAGPR